MATGRIKRSHILGLVGLFAFSLYIFGSSTSSSSTSRYSSHGDTSHASTVRAYCPHSNAREHIPTVILQADSGHDKDSNRTFILGDRPGEIPPNFLPYAYPPRDLRFAQKLATTGPNAVQPQQALADEQGIQLCAVHEVPSSPPPAVPAGWVPNRIMFGMSTTPDRVLYNLPVWAHWLPAASTPLDPSSHEAKQLPLVLILTPPPNPTEQMRMREAVDEANSRGMHVRMEAKESDRFETRYFALAEEMWKEAIRREEEESVSTEWFVFSDDDTFYPDFDALVRLLSSYDPDGEHIIGALSESTKQVAQWGHIAYGGAGIYVSRGLMARMNAPGVWNECLARFGASFGGDAMVTHCAALALEKDVKDTLIVEDTLHQMDIRGDGTGWLQSGFRITSIHHFFSWWTFFVPWHESGQGDLRKGVLLAAKAAKLLGGDNWLRRYSFEEGKVLVALGYSVTIHAKALSPAELARSEHTWFEYETFHPIRSPLEEARDKRNYWLTAVRSLDKGVVRLTHKNREGERVDIIWDGRAKPGGKGWW